MRATGEESLDPRSSWDNAVLAAALIAVDPLGLGGVWVHGHPGPVLTRWSSLLHDLHPPDTRFRRLPANVGDDRLLGGVDLSATLSLGRPVIAQGLLAETDGGVVLVPTAERLAPGTAARLAATLDTGLTTVERDGVSARHAARLAVVAFDESREEDDQLPAVLTDRLALAIDLRSVDLRSAERIDPPLPDLQAILAARQRLRSVAVDDIALETICGGAVLLGVESLRVALLAVHAAVAHAALLGRSSLEEADLQAAARLVLAARATRIPAAPAAPETAPEESETPEGGDDGDHRADRDPADGGPGAERLVESVRATLPPDLLMSLLAGGQQRTAAAGGRRGDGVRSRRRGRPAGTVRGDPRRGDRLNVAATLRAAAPWQTLRGGGGGTVRILPDDFRTTRHLRGMEAVTVFVVDASGSAALHRLAEAKGAVELLLAECYVRRDQVALVVFRGERAELLLPPTRSLVRAKRELSGLPGGGPTPLAAGLDLAATVAHSVRRQGRRPGLVVLTDGRANVARDGETGREPAMRDAQDAARRIASAGIAGIVVDTSPRPRADAAELAEVMRAAYLPLPHADAESLSRAVILGQAARRRSAF